jgi:tRNA pseudouridine32 synthase/23S rRNA pseudouridine746 synthase
LTPVELTPLDAPAAELPARLPSPFGPPHPLARRAAARLQEELRSGAVAGLGDQERGKMFGVLVAADGAGRIGFLRAFSGMLGGRWRAEGFVGPLFDEAARDAFWPAGEAELDAADERLAALTARAAAAREALAGCEAGFDVEGLRARHQARRQARQNHREGADPATLAALAQESRADAFELRHQRSARAAACAPHLAELASVEAAITALKRARVARSCQLLEILFQGYRLLPGPRPLRELFAPATPPGGAADCAAPKLIGHALAHGLRPLALAEFWWGAPPATGGRRHGVFYPACRGKCGPVLAHMLSGLDLEPAPEFGLDAPPGPLRVLHEDRWLVVVDKPPGLLSVPGRAAHLGDSVQTRLQARHPGALVAHRLDLDTSGLLVAARDTVTHQALQGLFRRRQVEKRYLAWLDGSPAGDAGTIELPLRVDLDDRPRQIHDPVHGKAAITDWQVLRREGARTLVALFPRTGRTHQLRVHAAHPLGLSAPIAGDRLYGEAGALALASDRLLLHAERLVFVHPGTGQRLELTSPAPFTTGG